MAALCAPTVLDMTTLLASPDAAVRPRSDAPRRFVAWFRGSAVRYVTGAVLYDSGTGAGRERLVLPVDHPVVARVKMRAAGDRVTVDVVSGHQGLAEDLSDAVDQALREVCEVAGLVGQVTVNLTVPVGRHSGTDLIETACHAAVAALLEATDTQLDRVARTQLVSQNPVHAYLTAAGDERGVHRVADGKLLTPLDVPRYAMLLLYRVGGDTRGLDAVGQRPVDSGDPLADLLAANGPAISPVSGLVREVGERLGDQLPGLGILGGQSDDAPVVWLMPAGLASVEASKLAMPLLSSTLSQAFPGWTVTFTSTAP